MKPDNEREFENEVFEYLKWSNQYCMIRRQFCMANNDWRLDILAVDKSFRMWVYELKMKYKLRDIAQVQSYLVKLKPYKAILLYLHGEYAFNSFEDIAVYSWEDGMKVRYEAETGFNGFIPKYMLLRLNPFYQEKLDPDLKNYWCNDEFRFYAERECFKMGLTNQKQMAVWWKVLRKKKRTKDNSLQYMLDDFIKHEGGKKNGKM